MKDYSCWLHHRQLEERRLEAENQSMTETNEGDEGDAVMADTEGLIHNLYSGMNMV